MTIWTFGCSFTEYFWPTWADILIKHASTLGHDGYNLGRCDAGNQFIASRIWECNAKYSFAPDDYVFICWSSFNREDRFVSESENGRGNWVNPGNIASQGIYKNEFIKNWADERHYAMRDCMLITSTLKALDSLGVKVINWTMNPYLQPDTSNAFHSSNSVQEVIKTYNICFKYPSMMEFMDTLDQSIRLHDTKYKNRLRVSWDGRDPIVEFHPSPAEHLNYLQSFICKDIPWATSLSSEAVELAETWENRLTSFTKPIPMNQANIGWSTKHSLNLWG